MKRQMRREQHQVAPPVDVVPCWTEGVRDAHPLEPADGFGEDLRTAPSDATKNIGQWTADADEVVAAVEARAEYDARSPKQGDISREKFRRERGSIGADEDRTRVA
jgi:hypothetical protein